jgi:hypothetical protein
MDGVDLDAIFNMMKSRKQHEDEFPDRASEFEFDADANGDAEANEGEESATVCRLDDGSYHVCAGMSCPFMEQSEDSGRHYLCGKSGLYVGSHIDSKHDASWTGRSCGSADPDMASGAVKIRTWKTKRDIFNDSVRAYDRSSKISIDEHAYMPPKQYDSSGNVIESEKGGTDDGQPSKRGAPCICDIDEKAVAEHKLNKANKRANVVHNADVRARLLAEAAHVARKLLATLEGVHAASAQPPAAHDPKYENYDFVLQVGIRRHISRCKEMNEQVKLSTIHDICITSNAFVKQRRRDAAKRERAIKARVIATDGRTIDLCATLVVAMWSAVCLTPHFMKQISGDSFKPFAAGIMYALKRGVWLPSGVMIIPQLEDLSDQLPVLRSTVASATAKQLQASSHKGLCAIHKAISSIDRMSDPEKLAVGDRLSVASTIAHDLKRHATIL